MCRRCGIGPRNDFWLLSYVRRMLVTQPVRIMVHVSCRMGRGKRSTNKKSAAAGTGAGRGRHWCVAVGAMHEHIDGAA